MKCRQTPATLSRQKSPRIPSRHRQRWHWQPRAVRCITPEETRRPGGETGRRTGLKILYPVRGVRVRAPLRPLFRTRGYIAAPHSDASSAIVMRQIVLPPAPAPPVAADSSGRSLPARSLRASTPGSALFFSPPAAYSLEFRATRKPMWLFRLDGVNLPRYPDRQCADTMLQPPPRSTRFQPVSGPGGSFDGSLA